METEQMPSSTSNTRSQVFKDSFRYLLATLIGQAVSVIRAVMIPVLFSPAQLGVWNFMNVVLSYGGNAHLGALHAMNKAIPLLRSQGKTEEVEIVKDSIFWFNLLLGVVMALSLWLAATFAPAGYVVGLRIVGLVAFFQLIFAYLFSLLRADSRFDVVSRGVVGLSISSTILIILLAYGFSDHLAGALIGFGLAYALIVVYWVVKGNYRLGFKVHYHTIREMLWMGIPLIAISFLDVVFLSVDRWLIATSLGETKLGYYALAIMASNLLGLVPSSVSSVLYPRMLERFAINQDPTAVGSLLLGPMRALAALMVIIICGAALGLPLLIEMAVPKYLPSIPVMEVLILGAFFLAMSYIPGSYLVSVNKQNWLIGIQIVASLFVFLMDSLLLRAGFGVLGVAIGTAIGYAVYGMGYAWASVYLAIGDKIEVMRFLIRLLWPFLVMALAVATANVFIVDGATLRSRVGVALCRLTVATSVVMGTIWLANRDGEVMAVVRTEIMSRWFQGRKST